MPIISGSAGSASLSGVVISGAGAAGKVPVASGSGAGTWAFPPGYEIGYDAITANVTVSSTTESSGNTVITCGAHTFDGGAVLVQGFFNVEPSSSAPITICLFEGATQITRLAEVFIGAISSFGVNVTPLFHFTPTAAAHTYTVTAFRGGAGNGTIVAGAGGTATEPPCFVRFVKV